VIGLSQGVFDVSVPGTGEPVVRRAAITETLLDSTGSPVRDEGMKISVGELRKQVNRALGGDPKK